MNDARLLREFEVKAGPLFILEYTLVASENGPRRSFTQLVGS